MKTKEGSSIEEVSEQGTFTTDPKVIKEYEECRLYNENILTHPEPIKHFSPDEFVLIRYFRRLPYLLKDNNFINTPTLSDYAKVTKRADTGQVYSLKEVPVSFKFQNKAVIVRLPDFLQKGKYKEGDVVVTMPVDYAAQKEEDTTFAAYYGAFLHPDSNMILPTDDVTNPWYGYALVPKSKILGKC